jgi:hypothetical protein
MKPHTPTPSANILKADKVAAEFEYSSTVPLLLYFKFQYLIGSEFCDEFC